MFNKLQKKGNAYIIKSDFPDLDVIRVDDCYYMVSTTMHLMPGCVILRSYNLIDWEFCSYVYDQLDGTDAQYLFDNKGIYGRGMWAASLRYNEGIFYVSFVCNDTHKTYLYTSSSITGPWKKSEISGFYHDMSILFDDDGEVYVVSGNTDIHLTQMKKDLSGPKENGIDKIIIQDDRENVNLGYEGSHIYKINGKYYIFLIHLPKGKMRTEACFVSDKIDGIYTGGDVLCSDIGNWNSGVAQGGIVQTNDNKWFGILFQDHGALGRLPVLVPVTFENDFPVFGKDGLAPDEVEVLDNRPGYKYKPLYTSDFADENNNLNECWQWNHIPQKKLISLKKNELEIQTEKICINPVQAANTLTQRTFTEKCEGSVFVNCENLKNGDFAGLMALEGEYAFIAVKKENDRYYLCTAEHKIDYTPWSMGVYDDKEPVFLEKIEIENSSLELKLKFNLERPVQQVEMFYRTSGEKDFVQLGKASKLRYTLDQFVGVRFGCFIYSTKESGGKVKFTNFKYNLW